MRPITEIPDELIANNNIGAQTKLLTQDEIDDLLGEPEWVEKRETDFLYDARIEALNGNYDTAIALLSMAIDRRGK